MLSGGSLCLERCLVTARSQTIFFFFFSVLAPFCLALPCGKLFLLSIFPNLEFLLLPLPLDFYIICCLRCLALLLVTTATKNCWHFLLAVLKMLCAYLHFILINVSVQLLLLYPIMFNMALIYLFISSNVISLVVDL